MECIHAGQAGKESIELAGKGEEPVMVASSDKMKVKEEGQTEKGEEQCKVPDKSETEKEASHHFALLLTMIRTIIINALQDYQNLGLVVLSNILKPKIYC